MQAVWTRFSGTEGIIVALSMDTRIKLQALAEEHNVTSFGIPYITMICRIKANANLSKEDEELLKNACVEMGVNYDKMMAKKAKKPKKAES